MEWLWPTQCGGCGQVGQGRICLACRAVDPWRVPPPTPSLDGLLVLDRYDSGLGEVIRVGKTRGERALIVGLGEILGRRAWPVVGADFDLLVPAPSTRRARLRRGFSAASILAASLSRLTGTPTAGVLDLQEGAQQAGLSARARRRNLHGRIEARHALPRRVLLVDDVVTTGATLDACARAVRVAGAEVVWAIAPCFALPVRGR